jgi:hypothetical protein
VRRLCNTAYENKGYEQIEKCFDIRELRMNFHNFSTMVRAANPESSLTACKKMHLTINNEQLSITEIFSAEYRESVLNGQAYKGTGRGQGSIS